MKKYLLSSIIAICLATGAVQNAQANTNHFVNIGCLQFVVVTVSSTDLTVIDVYLASPYFEQTTDRFPSVLNIPSEIPFNGSILTVKKIANSFGIPTTPPHPTNAEIITTLYIAEGYERIENRFADCTNLTTLSLPSTLKYIGDYAFWNDTALTSVTLSEGLEYIGQGSFMHTGLTAVTIPESVIALDNYAFDNCVNLARATLPSTLQEIPAALFRGTALTSIEIPSAVTYVRNLAFANCAVLQQVKVHWQTASAIAGAASNAFSGVTTANVTLIVPRGTKSLYQTANVWRNFRIIEDGEPSVAPSASTAVISWYSEPSATGYKISVFNADSTLHGEYNLNASGQQNAPAQNLLGFGNLTGLNSTANGNLSFTIQGLTAETPYFYTLAVIAGTDTIARYNAAFETTNETGITSITKDELQITVDGNLLSFENLTGLESVQIFDVSGRNVGALHATPATNGSQTINIAHLPAGIYIVKAGAKTAKFVKK